MISLRKIEMKRSSVFSCQTPPGQCNDTMLLWVGVTYPHDPGYATLCLLDLGLNTSQHVE